MASEAIEQTYSWLRAAGYMKGPIMADKEWSLDERDEMSRAFSSGNYANAYESTDLEDFDLEDMSEHERAAFVLGFLGSYSLNEISDREIFDEAYHSDAGRYVVNVAGYCDSRDDEYADEDGAYAELMSERPIASKVQS